MNNCPDSCGGTGRGRGAQAPRSRNLLSTGDNAVKKRSRKSTPIRYVRLPTQREIRDYRMRDLTEFTNRVVRIVEDITNRKN